MSVVGDQSLIIDWSCPQCTDIQLTPKNGTPPFTMTVSVTMYFTFQHRSNTISGCSCVTSTFQYHVENDGPHQLDGVIGAQHTRYPTFPLTDQIQL